MIKTCVVCMVPRFDDQKCCHVYDVVFDDKKVLPHVWCRVLMIKKCVICMVPYFDDQ